MISYHSDVNNERLSKADIVINGSSITAENRLKSICDLSGLKRCNLNKTPTSENIPPSTAK